MTKSVPRISLLVQHSHKLFKTKAQCLSIVLFLILPQRLWHLLFFSPAFYHLMHTLLSAVPLYCFTQSCTISHKLNGHTVLYTVLQISIFFTFFYFFLFFIFFNPSSFPIKIKSFEDSLRHYHKWMLHTAHTTHSLTHSLILSPAHGCHSPLTSHVLLIVVHALSQLQDTSRKVLIDVLTLHICRVSWHRQGEEHCKTDKWLLMYSWAFQNCHDPSVMEKSAFPDICRRNINRIWFSYSYWLCYLCSPSGCCSLPNPTPFKKLSTFVIT